MISRRTLGAAAAAAALAPMMGAGRAPSGRLAETRAGGRRLTLDARPHPLQVASGPGQTPAWLYGEAFPVLRMRHGEALDVVLRNGLGAQHTTIHWHGVRVPNAMDGVPYMTQAPVQPGQAFTYRFTPPDPGTYFFHPHCNTVEQFGRGLLGALIVEERHGPAFDDDLVLILKDWRLAEDGSFLPFITPEGASRAGTFGTVRTVNGVVEPQIAVPAGADVRLRLINCDPTRIAAIAIEGAEAAIIAIDGNPVIPFPLKDWRLGPGMRLDVALRTPATGAVKLVDTFAPDPVPLAGLVGSGAPRRRTPFAPPTLDGALTAPPPVFTGAPVHTLELGAGVAPAAIPETVVTLPNGRRVDLSDSLCLSSSTLWTLDGQSWPERGHGRLPPPLLSLTGGQPVVIEYFNATPRAHPMHIHGHTMTVLHADRLRRPLHRADTVLVMPNERVKVGFVADNPGAWMIHCHILEHQETGMMGWLRVA